MVTAFELMKLTEVVQLEGEHVHFCFEVREVQLFKLFQARAKLLEWVAQQHELMVFIAAIRVKAIDLGAALSGFGATGKFVAGCLLRGSVCCAGGGCHDSGRAKGQGER